jgi:hypothetical protein
MTEEWRKFHNEELHNLYSSPQNEGDQIKENEMGGEYSAHGEMRNAYKILVGNPKENRPLGRPRCRSEDNIKMNYRKIGFGGVDWIYVAQDKDQCRDLVNTVRNLRVT